MPRLPRFDLPGYPLREVQRGNNRQTAFFDDADYRDYLDWLGLGARQYGVEVHAWCLMTNHGHLIVEPGEAEYAVAKLMRRLAGRLMQKIRASLLPPLLSCGQTVRGYLYYQDVTDDPPMKRRTLR